MKESDKSHLKTSNKGATNSKGFTAIQGSDRSYRTESVFCHVGN